MPSTTSKIKPAYNWEFDAIGTHWSIETEVQVAQITRKKIIKYIDDFDRVYSRFRNDSIISQVAAKAGKYKLPIQSEELARLYYDLYEATDGAMSPLVGDGLVAAGYDKDYSLSPTIPLPAFDWQAGFSWDGKTIETKKPTVIDIGAAGKGYLVDGVAGILEGAGLAQYVVDASGDVRHRGTDEQIIGLENPYDPTRVIGTVAVSNKSICASATNRRKWADGWHHILDARTGLPVREVVATWVIADTTMLTDGLATALFFVGIEQLRSSYDFQAVRIFSSGKIEKSENFVGQLFV